MIQARSKCLYLRAILIIDKAFFVGRYGVRAHAITIVKSGMLAV
jgi:hypothetical protein